MRRGLRVLRNPVGWYRAARWLAGHRIPLLPRFIDYTVRITFGCWVPHTAKIGRNVVLGYAGLGVVIHDHAIIGDRVEIGQGVTLGGNARQKGHPEIADDVYIGCGAKVLGPVKVGEGSVIGANSVVLCDVPEHCVVVGAPARVIREGIDVQQYLFHRRRNAGN